MRTLTLLLASIPAFGQFVPLPFTHVGGGAAPIFVTSSACSGGNCGAGTASATVATVAATTTAGDGLFVSWGNQIACTSQTGSTYNASVSDTGVDTFKPVPPNNSNGYVIAVALTSGGSNCTSGPVWTASGGGCSTEPTITTNAFTMSGPVTSIVVSNVGAGCNSAPNLSAGSGCTVAPTAVVSTIGIDSDTGVSCLASWYATGIAGTTNNIITAGFSSATGAYSTVSSIEFRNASTLDTSWSAGNVSAATVSGNNFTTTNANEIIISGTRVESLSGGSWSGTGSACTAVTGGACTYPAGANTTSNIMSSGYGILTTTQTGVAMGAGNTVSAPRGIIGASFH